VRFLRRRSAEDADAATQSTADSDGSAAGEVAPGHTPGKGRPTPKRRDAEGRRRGPAPPPPRTQRESMKLAKQNRASREERRKANAERRGRMLAAPRERGPVKAFIRDSIDSRRHLMGLFMPLALFSLVSVAVPDPLVRNLVSLATMSFFLAIVLEAVLLGRRITRDARERFPKEEIKAVPTTFYAFSRGMQIRKLRVPKPRVGYGDKV
jgi:hypothetical protein